MRVKTWRDPYDSGFSVTQPKEIELHEGLTVLVGCNGAGKSTLLRNISEHCKKQNVPYFFYDNLHSGGSNALADAMHSDFAAFVGLFSSSEGEAIKANLARKSSYFQNFIQTGIIDDRQYQFLKAMKSLSDDKYDEVTSDVRVFLFDAIDSGMSVDAVVEVKEMFNQIVEDCQKAKKKVYILISANEYELARECDCFDVNVGKYLRFADYMDYRKFICRSRLQKEKRYAKQQKWAAQQRTKELLQYRKVLQVTKEKREKLLASKNPSRWKLEHIEDAPKQFLRSARFISEEDVAYIENST